MDNKIKQPITKNNVYKQEISLNDSSYITINLPFTPIFVWVYTSGTYGWGNVYNTKVSYQKWAYWKGGNGDGATHDNSEYINCLNVSGNVVQVKRASSFGSGTGFLIAVCE